MSVRCRVRGDAHQQGLWIRGLHIEDCSSFTEESDRKSVLVGDGFVCPGSIARGSVLTREWRVCWTGVMNRDD